jgi:hypothetical protein
LGTHQEQKQLKEIQQPPTPQTKKLNPLGALLAHLIGCKKTFDYEYSFPFLDLANGQATNCGTRYQG